MLDKAEESWQGQKLYLIFPELQWQSFITLMPEIKIRNKMPRQRSHDVSSSHNQVRKFSSLSTKLLIV